MADDQQDKTEKPSPHRLKEAREKGQVAKSAELASVITLIVFFAAFSSGLAGIAVAFARAMRQTLAMAGAVPAFGPGLAHWMAAAFAPAWQALLPSLFALVVAAVMGNVVQTGPLFSTHPLRPDLSKLNPVKGFKRIVSLRTAWDLFRLVLKLAIVGALAWWLIGDLVPGLFASEVRSPSDLPAELGGLFSKVVKWMLVVLALVAVLDLLFSRREFVRKLRMSRRDMKDEHKRHEGDPAVRSRRRKLARELAQRVSSVGKVKEADVVVVNPTHIAVALRYRSGSMLAPEVVSKGAGWLASRIRREAARHGVPLTRSPELARQLFRFCEIGAPVPEEAFTDVGKVYRWVMSRPGHKVHTS